MTLNAFTVNNRAIRNQSYKAAYGLAQINGQCLETHHIRSSLDLRPQK